MAVMTIYDASSLVSYPIDWEVTTYIVKIGSICVVSSLHVTLTKV